ncbi:unnamed protein product [Lepidochelys olivacea]
MAPAASAPHLRAPGGGWGGQSPGLVPPAVPRGGGVRAGLSRTPRGVQQRLRPAVSPAHNGGSRGLRVPWKRVPGQEVNRIHCRVQPGPATPLLAPPVSRNPPAAAGPAQARLLAGTPRAPQRYYCDG